MSSNCCNEPILSWAEIVKLCEKEISFPFRSIYVLFYFSKLLRRKMIVEKVALKFHCKSIYFREKGCH